MLVSIGEEHKDSVTPEPVGYSEVFLLLGPVRLGILTARGVGAGIAQQIGQFPRSRRSDRPGSQYQLKSPPQVQDNAPREQLGRIRSRARASRRHHTLVLAGRGRRVDRRANESASRICQIRQSKRHACSGSFSTCGSGRRRVQSQNQLQAPVRGRIRTGVPFEVFDLSYSSLPHRSHSRPSGRCPLTLGTRCDR